MLVVFGEWNVLMGGSLLGGLGGLFSVSVFFCETSY